MILMIRHHGDDVYVTSQLCCGLRGVARFVVLESGLESVFAGLGLGLELGGSASKSFFKSFVLQDR